MVSPTACTGITPDLGLPWPLCIFFVIFRFLGKNVVVGIIFSDRIKINLPCRHRNQVDRPSLLLNNATLTARCKDLAPWARVTRSPPARTPSHVIETIGHRGPLVRITGCFKGECRCPNIRNVMEFARTLREMTLRLAETYAPKELWSSLVSLFSRHGSCPTSLNFF